MSDDIIQQAKDMGWTTQEEFKGKPDLWVDAETWVQRGTNYLPIVNKHRKKLMGEVTTLKAALAESQAAILALQEGQTAEVQRKVKEARQQLLLNLEQAKTDGNIKQEVALTNELIELNSAAKEVQETKPAAKSTISSDTMDPVFLEFAEQNPWYGVDVRKTNKANGIANLIRSDEANDHLTGKQFFVKLLAAMNGEPLNSKVAGGGSTSSNTGAGGDGGKTYNDLPAEAKSQCEKQAKQFVGTGKRFADITAWRNRYTELFFQE